MGQDALLCAAKYRDSEMFHKLLDLEADPKVVDKFSRNVLHYAASSGNPQTVSRALECGLDVNGVDSSGWSPLHWAAGSSWSNTNIIEQLLAAGCDQSLKDHDGFTPVELALRNGNPFQAAILRGDTRYTQPLHPRDNRSSHRDFWKTAQCDGCYEVSGHTRSQSLLPMR